MSGHATPPARPPASRVFRVQSFAAEVRDTVLGVIVAFLVGLIGGGIAGQWRVVGAAIAFVLGIAVVWFALRFWEPTELVLHDHGLELQWLLGRRVSCEWSAVSVDDAKSQRTLDYRAVRIEWPGGSALVFGDAPDFDELRAELKRRAQARE